MSQPVIVNNPGASDSGSGMGFLLGAILLVAVILGALYYGVPYVRQAAPEAPQVNNIEVPDQIDVNVTTPQGE